MINLSMSLTLELWDELRDCLDGTNNYGGDTAEIYAYRLARHHIPRKQGGEYPEEDEEQIASSLTNLLQHFCTRHDCAAEIECSGAAVMGTVRIFPRPGKGGSIPPFSHRAHVKIREWPTEEK